MIRSLEEGLSITAESLVQAYALDEDVHPAASSPAYRRRVLEPKVAVHGKSTDTAYPAVATDEAAAASESDG